MKIEIEVSESNEGTSYPWWMIIDPDAITASVTDTVGEIGMGAVTGPYFSREEAERALETHRHNYSQRAVVWCASGYRSEQYRTQIDRKTIELKNKE